MQVLDQPAVDEHHPPTRSGGFGMRRNDPPRPFDFRWGRRKSGVGGGNLLRVDQGFAVKAELAALPAG